MNRCEYYLENLSAYLDGELPENEMKDVEEHLRECRSCSRELEILRAIASACGEMEEELPDGFSSSLHMRLEEARNEIFTKRNKKGQIRVFAQMAAGFAIVIALGLTVRFGFPGNRALLGEKTEAEVAPMAAGPTHEEFSLPQNSENMSTSFGINAFEKSKSSYDTGENGQNPDTARSADMKGGTYEETYKTEDSRITLTFSDDVLLSGDEEYDYDTEIIIVVDDIDKAIESIMAINERIDTDKKNNFAYLSDTITAYRGSKRNGFVELKLVYTGKEAQQSFLEAMKSTFSEIQVEPVSHEDNEADDREYIKVIIEKKK